MNADLNNFKRPELTDKIIRAFYDVYNTLGYGFLERVYVNALSIELDKNNIPWKLQHPITVHYDGKVVGEYFADLVIDNRIIVEVKAVKSLLPDHEAQLLNYLKATNIEVGLLLNFGPKAEFKRKVFENSRK